MSPYLLLLVVLVAEVVEQSGQSRAIEAGGRSVGGVLLLPVALVLLPPQRDPEVLQVGSADEGLHPIEVAAWHGALHDR